MTRSDRLALGCTEVFAPQLLTTALLLGIGTAATPDRGHGLAWGALAALFTVGIPFGSVLLAVRRGRLGDKYVDQRAQRLVPMLLSVVSLAVGLAVLLLGRAPQALVAVVVSTLAGLVVTTAITARWKISIHTGVAAGTGAVLVVALGPWSGAGGGGVVGAAVAGLGSLAVVAAVGWSRVHLSRHTPAQVLAGAAVGAAVSALVYAPLAPALALRG